MLPLILNTDYRGLKLTDQAMKLLARVLDSSIRGMVNIDSMQFGFVPGQGTSDAIFIIHHLQEKHFAANKPLYLAFVNLEKGLRPGTKESHWGLEKPGCGGMGCVSSKACTPC